MRPDNSLPGLESRKFVDPETGVGNVQYYWKRKPLEQIPICGRMVDRLAGLTLIDKDLNNAARWFRRAQALIPAEQTPRGGYGRSPDRETFDLVKALFVASLTFYGKCFVTAEGRRTQVSRDWLDMDYREVHDFYINYRHKVAAHSGDRDLEYAQTFVLLHPKKKKNVAPMLATMRLQPDIVLPETGDNGFGELLQHVIDLVGSKHDDLTHKIIEELIKPKGPEFWRKAARKGRAVSLDGDEKDNS